MPAADVHDKQHGEDPPPRVVILAVRPEVDGGRYPAKRVVGDTVDVEVDLTSDGHDVVRALLLHRPPGDNAWHEVELLAVGNDTWRASFVATTLGRHHYTVIAWVDAFASWRHGLERKAQVGTDVSVELLAGPLLVDAAAMRAERADLDSAAMLRDLAGVLRSTEPMDSRVATALSATLAEQMARVPDRSHAARYRLELELHVERPLAATSSWYELF